jgi:hypothetical protein
MTLRGFTLFPSVEHDPSLRRSGLPITVEKRNEAEARHRSTSLHRAARDKDKALRAADQKPAKALRRVPVAELTAALNTYKQIIEAQDSEQARDRLRDLIHRTLGGDVGAAGALRKIVVVHAEQSRAEGRLPPDWWLGRSRRVWGDGSSG